MVYCTDDARRRVSRFDAEQQICETYNFTNLRWEFDNEVMGTQSGDLWLDEISQEEAFAIIERRTRKPGIDRGSTQ